MSDFLGTIKALINSRRNSPVQGQIYLLKIAYIYGNFTPIGDRDLKRLFWGIFRKLGLCKKLSDILLK